MQRQKDNLALPSAEHQAIENSQAGVETWKYKAKNSLMYYPEGEQAGLAGSMEWGCMFVSGLQGVCVCAPWASEGSCSASGQKGPCVVSEGVGLPNALLGFMLLFTGASLSSLECGAVMGHPSTSDTLPPLFDLPGVPDEEQLFKKPRQVVHKNTRFLRDPFSQALSRSQLQQAAALNAQVSGWGWLWAALN